jgi:hypothetical protein
MNWFSLPKTSGYAADAIPLLISDFPSCCYLPYEVLSL